MFTPKGKFGWYELMTSDPKAAGKFYSDVVGWTTQEMSSPDGSSYTTFNIGNVGMAGMLTVPGHTAWIGYISVDDVDAHIEKIVEAGGKLWRPATDIPGMLRFAAPQPVAPWTEPLDATRYGPTAQRRPFMDGPTTIPEPSIPGEGTLNLNVFTPNPAMPPPQRPAPPAPGTISWHELYTTDLDAGFDFYQKMFGWTKLNDMDMGPMGTYRIFDQGDHKEMGDGGMMIKPPQAPVSSWNFYFSVDSIKAAVGRVESGGGKVVNGPMQVPGGGWIIQGQDPQGAMFSLVSSQE